MKTERNNALSFEQPTSEIFFAIGSRVLKGQRFAQFFLFNCPYFFTHIFCLDGMPLQQDGFSVESLLAPVEKV